MKLQYHQQTFDVLDKVPKISQERLERVTDFEAQHGLLLPAAMREWYSLENCIALLEKMSIIGHIATDLEEARRYESVHQPELGVQELFPVLIENQGVWHIAVDLLDGDNPRVYLRYNDPGELWIIHAHSFSDWIYAHAWDHAILVQKKGQYFFVDSDEQWNQHLSGNDMVGPETFLGNAVFKGKRFLRVIRQGKRLLVIAPERDPDETSFNEFDVVSQAEFHRKLPRGEESDWMVFAELAIQHGRIAVSDPMLYRDLPAPPTFDMAVGTYTVSVRIMAYGEDKRVSRLRVFGTATAIVGALIGDVGVDFGQVGVFDPILLNQISDRMSEEQAMNMVNELGAIGLAGVVHPGEGDATMPVVSSGFGDGRYPIHELVHAGHRVGIEIVFIGPEISVELEDSG
jgi:hypothetical protein